MKNPASDMLDMVRNCIRATLGDTSANALTLEFVGEKIDEHAMREALASIERLHSYYEATTHGPRGQKIIKYFDWSDYESPAFFVYDHHFDVFRRYSPYEVMFGFIFNTEAEFKNMRAKLLEGMFEEYGLKIKIESVYDSANLQCFVCEYRPDEHKSILVQIQFTWRKVLLIESARVK